MSTSERRGSMDMRLWDFSLQIYRLPGVAPACLRCQLDEAGADVNLILFLLWWAVARYRLAEGRIALLDALVAPWREHIVEPLRAMRRELKSESLDETGAFREQIKTVGTLKPSASSRRRSPGRWQTRHSRTSSSRRSTPRGPIFGPMPRSPVGLCPNKRSRTCSRLSRHLPSR